MQPTVGSTGRPAYDPAMLLAIDIGNTNVTLGLFKAGASRRRAARRRQPRATVDELELLIDGLLRLDGPRSPTSRRSRCASVVPALTGAVEAIAARRERPLVVAPPGPSRSPSGSTARRGRRRTGWSTPSPRRGLYGTPAVVVDFGTATTLDCVAADGAYVGGAIAPGLELGWRRSRHGPRSCRGSSCAPRTGRSAATP